MQLGQKLIDKAADMGLTRYRIAKLLEENESFLGKVHAGTKPVPPALAARIAALAGQDARYAALQAVVDAEKDPAKRDELGALFGVRPTPLDQTSTKVFFTRTTLLQALRSERLERESHRSVMDSKTLTQLVRRSAFPRQLLS